jgi:hypothetical protein
MTVKVEQTKVGTLVEWEGVESTPVIFELVPERGFDEGEVSVQGDVSAYGTTFTAKPAEPQSPSGGESPR